MCFSVSIDSVTLSLNARLLLSISVLWTSYIKPEDEQEVQSPVESQFVRKPIIHTFEQHQAAESLEFNLKEDFILMMFSVMSSVTRKWLALLSNSWMIWFLSPCGNESQWLMCEMWCNNGHTLQKKVITSCSSPSMSLVNGKGQTME